MSASQSYDARTIKGKKAAVDPPSLANPGHSGPTTFFLRSEKDIEGAAQRGRKASRSSESLRMEGEEEMSTAPSKGAIGDSSFGVESLASITSAFPSEDSLSRTNSNNTEPGTEGGAEEGTPARRKRRANPVHPRISATGQRIISGSGEHLPTQASLAASPVSFRSAESPMRSRSHLRRRGSAASSINLSQPLTPLRMSPHPDSAMPSTPRSGSPKSFRLSDEECSVADESGSQAITSGGEEEEDIEESRGSSMPQLVMPSIAMPSRRPFTDKGRRMGRLRVMVVGSNSVGKTSLIQSIFRTCEDIVHVDSALGSAPSLPRRGVDYDLNEGITETYASTRPYPNWWTDFESRRMLHRRKSIGDGVLERNLCFVDTPGVDQESGVLQVLKYFNSSQERTASLEKMTDSELISVLSGDGGIQIDAVLWLFDPTNEAKLEGPQRHLFEALCRSSNVIPLIGRADGVDAEMVTSRKRQILDMVDGFGLETYSLSGNAGKEGDSAYREPLLVSSALDDDAETIDASVLMSSQYVQPLMPSELGYLVEQLLEPDNIARMRHLSATKFLLWRQHHLGFHIQRQTLLQSPQFGHTLPSVTSTGSMLDEPSKVLVPHSSSSYYRSASPSASDASVPAGTGASTYALARYNEQTQGGAPFRQVRLAKWAQDLQRGLDNERKRYKEMYLNRPAEWTSADSDAEKYDNEKALTTTHDRPQRGRLGGAIAVIDPRDPLGVLAFGQAFRRRGWFALQVAGGCGLIGAAAWWVMRNWVEVQEWIGGSPAMVNTPVVPAPTKGLMDYLEDLDWRGFFGWDR